MQHITVSVLTLNCGMVDWAMDISLLVGLFSKAGPCRDHLHYGCREFRQALSNPHSVEQAYR